MPKLIRSLYFIFLLLSVAFVSPVSADTTTVPVNTPAVSSSADATASPTVGQELTATESETTQSPESPQLTEPSAPSSKTAVLVSRLKTIISWILTIIFGLFVIGVFIKAFRIFEVEEGVLYQPRKVKSKKTKKGSKK